MVTTTPLTINDQPDIFWAYFAGIIDGEGSIMICSAGPRLNIANTYKPMLEEFKDAVGVGSVTQAKSVKQATRPSYNYQIFANGMRSILPKVIPYLREKRVRAERMMDYLDALASGSSSRRDAAKVAFQEVASTVRNHLGSGNESER